MTMVKKRMGKSSSESRERAITKLLIASSFVIIVLMGAFQIGAIHQVNILAELTTKMYRHPLTVSNAVLEANANIISMHRYMKDVVLARNDLDLEYATFKVNANEAQVLEKFELIIERFLGDKSVILDARKMFMDWKPIRVEVVKLKRAGNHEQAIAITKGKGADHVIILTKTMDQLIELARNKAAEFKSKSDAVHTKSVAILYLTMATVLMVTGLGFAFVIIKVNAWHKRLRESQTRLHQSQKMESVGQLTSGVAHDFNNILAIMIGNAELLEESIGEGEEAKQSIKAIKGAVNRGASLTSCLLAYSRRQTLSPISANVTDLIRGLEDMLQRTLGEMIDLRVEETPALWPVTIDPHQFENALVNLALNARDAMPKGGTLTIETANATLDETYTEQHEELRPGDYVQVAVSDAGIGMPPEVLEKVFDPFFTTKEVGKGSGLGLSMVYGFAKQSNGHVNIYSEVDHGTTVKLYMPRSEEDVAKEGPKDETREIKRGSERILVVEDNEEVRKVPVNILRNQGYEVVEAGDGKEAIKRLKDGPLFDLLFTDVILPGGMNGIEIAEEAKKRQPNIKVLYTTGYTENSVVHHGRLDLGVTLINKPYLRAELLEKVRSMLDSVT